MVDTPDAAGLSVTVHGSLDGAALTPPLATATIILGDVVVTRGLTTLPMPLVVVAPPEALRDPAAGRPVPGGRALEVASIQLGTSQEAISLGGDDVTSAVSLALELEEAVLEVPRDVSSSARSVWCLIFPRLQACQPRR